MIIRKEIDKNVTYNIEEKVGDQKKFLIKTNSKVISHENQKLLKSLSGKGFKPNKKLR